MLDPPALDEGIQGARVGVADDALTGRFVGQHFTLAETQAEDETSLLDTARKLLAGGERLFVTDLPTPALIKLADLPGARATVIIDATNADDSLRGSLCRAAVLHTMPSRAMLADALMQYLVVKKWTRIMLLTGRDPGDRLYADAIRASAAKFQVTIKADRPWSFNPAAQQADTGHYEVNDEVAKATQDVSYDVLVVADEADNFGDELAYRTDAPRPVAGTSGLVPGAWSPVMDEYASTQLQLRFRKAAGRWMANKDYGAWLAVRAIGEAATRTGSSDPSALITYLHGADFVLSGYKGPELSFRAWDGQLRQPVLLADARSLVSISPQPGFLHETNDLDSLGVDQPETTCHF
jgi:ABC transporter substrate binding protein (PQQ-dependent alcohol dehydrogenase system)